MSIFSRTLFYLFHLGHQEKVKNEIYHSYFLKNIRPLFQIIVKKSNENGTKWDKKIKKVAIKNNVNNKILTVFFIVHFV